MPGAAVFRDHEATPKERDALIIENQYPRVSQEGFILNFRITRVILKIDRCRTRTRSGWSAAGSSCSRLPESFYREEGRSWRPSQQK
jgi:hypothetical protein